MPSSKKGAPTVGLILIILSIITLRLESSIFAAASFLMTLFGLIFILLPDIRRSKVGSTQPARGVFSASPTLSEVADRCALCGRPVPPDVAYCDECAKKRG